MNSFGSAYPYSLATCAFHSLHYSIHMPELPEVQTTVDGIRKRVVGMTISDAWSDYSSPHFAGSETIKDPAYFALFKKEAIGRTILSAERRAKNILINLSGNKTILIHMKMTGHVMYGQYHFNADKEKDPWQPMGSKFLQDPYNRHIHFVLTFKGVNGKALVLSDVRKFAKVAMVDTDIIHESVHLNGIGPEPLEDGFTYAKFKARLDIRPKGKIKQVLMDQAIVAGIGNIYADESLWRAGIHPLELVKNIPVPKPKELFAALKKTLLHGIDFGGDSTSDYRNIDGEKGSFHEGHHAYQRTGSKCDRRGCSGTIVRIVLGGRGTHFCDAHQILSAG